MSRSRRFSIDGVLRVQLSSRVIVLDMDQQNTHFLKHLENEVKLLAGKKKLRKGRFYYLQGGMGGETGPIL
jgi:hypothetical protein